MGKGEKGINLLPRAYIKEQTMKRFQEIGLILLSVEVIGFIIGGVILPRKTLDHYEQMLLGQRDKLYSSRYTKVNETLKSVEAIQTSIDKWQQIMDQVKEDDIGAKDLEALVTGVPEGVTLQFLNIYMAQQRDQMDQKCAEIQGISQTLEQELSYLYHLESLYPKGYPTHEVYYDQALMGYRFSIELQLEEDQQKLTPYLRINQEEGEEDME